MSKRQLSKSLLSSSSPSALSQKTLHRVCKSILSISLQKYHIIEQEISPHTISRAWNFKITHKKSNPECISALLLISFSPAPNLICGGLQTSSKSVPGQQRVHLSPALLSTSILAPKGVSCPQHQSSISVIWDMKGLQTVLHWSQGFTEELPWRSISEKKYIYKKMPRTKSLSSNLKTNSNEKHCGRIHW